MKFIQRSQRDAKTRWCLFTMTTYSGCSVCNLRFIFSFCFPRMTLITQKRTQIDGILLPRSVSAQIGISSFLLLILMVCVSADHGVLALTVKYISFFIGGHYPSECINDEFVLCGIFKYFASVAHIQVNHTVIGIGPNYRCISTRKNIF